MGGGSEGIPCGESSLSYSIENKEWLETGYGLLMGESGEYEWGFRIGHPSESDKAGFNAVPAFWSCGNKMMIYLLSKVDRPDGHCIRPHSRKVTTNPPPP